MKTDKWMNKSCNCMPGHAGGAVYGLGVLGALFYFLQHAGTFSLAIMGIVKAIFWPAFLVYQVLGLLKM